MLASACTASTSGYSARGLTHASSARAVGVKRCRRQQRLALQVASGRRRKHYEDYEEAEPELQAEEYTQEPQYQQGIDPTPPPAAQERRGVPLFITIPGALLVVFAVFRILKKLQSRGFVSQLDELLHKFMFLNSSCWRPCYVGR